METAKVSEKYQIVIPKKVREKLGIHRHDIVVFNLKGKEIEIDKLDSMIHKHAGSVRLKKKFKELRKEFEKEMQREALK